jgi:hypothetical protein
LAEVVSFVVVEEEVFAVVEVERVVFAVAVAVKEVEEAFWQSIRKSR